MSSSSPAQSYSRLVFGRCLLLFVPLAVICVTGAFFLFQFEVNANLAKIRFSEAASVQLSSRAIERSLWSAANDLTYLASHHGFAELYSGNVHYAYIHIQNDWLNFSRAKRIYDQIRWIDTKGQERVRINFKNGQAVNVPDGELQNKSNRYYFTDTIKLHKNELFISPFDLNIEHGTIEQPLKPMIRFGTPIFDQKGNNQGGLILNLLGEYLLDEFDFVIAQKHPNAWLLNKEGYWLKGPSTDLEWGFMYRRPEASMAHLYPKAWKRIATTKEGQFEDEDGLWSFATVYPLLDGLVAPETNADRNSRLKGHDGMWKTVFLIPRQEYRSEAKTKNMILVLITIVLLLVFFVGSLRLARAWASQKIAADELQRVNESLEQTVEERTREISEAKKKAEALARTDALTGMNNHRSFFEYANRINENSSRYGHPYSLIMLDLDFFKKINDTYGHQAGDKTLKVVGKVITNVLRSSDVAGRIGGEEFAIILPETSAQNAKDLAERLRYQIADTKISIGSDDLSITASFGISEHSKDDNSFEDVMKRADNALYQTKEQGRNGVVLY